MIRSLPRVACEKKRMVYTTRKETEPICRDGVATRCYRFQRWEHRRPAAADGGARDGQGLCDVIQQGDMVKVGDRVSVMWDSAILTQRF